MADARISDRGTPEFHVVVRRNGRRGPLAPYRLSMAVGFAMLVAGTDLLDAASSGTDIDTPLINAGLAAGFIWILSGYVSKILAAGYRPSAHDSSPVPDAERAT